MENFGRYLPEDFDEHEEEIVLKTFEETYKQVMFAMSVGMIYPNPATEKWRLLAIPFYIGLVSPVLYVMAYNMKIAADINDVDAIFKQSTIMGPFCGQFFKMLFLFLHRRNARAIFDEINHDYSVINTLRMRYKQVARHWISSNLAYEWRWAYCVTFATFSFPVLGVFRNMYSAFFDEEPRRLYIHDVDLPFGYQEKKFDTPVYEFIFLQTCICSCMYYINFVGYDGFLVLSVQHVSLKMKLCTVALEDAMKIEDEALRQVQIETVIKEHIKIYNYVGTVTETFSVWLSTITTAIVLHLCSCVYHLQGHGLQDVQFVFTTVAAVIYIYMLCSVVGTMSMNSLTMSDDIYCCGWENISDTKSRRMLVFMLARSQEPIQIKSLSMFNLDMEMFVMLVKMAYSMFTFLQQT
uniref:Odorant receptor n=1 Tax=Leucinodes orbonalis TaxID=711050 RepID=A0AAU0QLG3_9NEOP|nr:odorant receptor [Leucinodes orbonalis]